MLPVVVVVTGDLEEDVLPAVQVLQAALPDMTIRVHDPARESLAEASASSHLVLNVTEKRSPGSDAGFSDAAARSLSDFDGFVSRVRDFDRRRRAHELPPDLPPVITPWSPTWADSARRVGARLMHALTLSGVRAFVDHIGSTSVPGLPAKEIIDLQVAVPRLEEFDEADADLRSAGFVNVQHIAPDAPGVRSDNPRGSHTSPDEWEKRLYAGVDADQRTIVHVRRIGAANWRYALLFRDWLRANDGPRDAYAWVKADLAAVSYTHLTLPTIYSV